MSDNRILFEQRYRGDLWRLEIAFHKGSARGNWRKWFRDDEGNWRATKEGCTIPLERIPELAGSISAYLEQKALSAPQNGSES